MRQLAIAAATLLLFGCSDPPDAIDPVDQPIVPWTLPDTVQVYVGGEAAGDRVIWDEPDAQERSWLEQHDYIRDRVELHPKATDELKEYTEGNPVLEGLVMGKAYYVRH